LEIIADFPESTIKEKYGHQNKILKKIVYRSLICLLIAALIGLKYLSNISKLKKSLKKANF